MKPSNSHLKRFAEMIWKCSYDICSHEDIAMTSLENYKVWNVQASNTNYINQNKPTPAHLSFLSRVNHIQTEDRSIKAVYEA